jgi:chromate transporter
MQPTLSQLTLYFLRLGTTGFGGPIALANYIRADLVDRLEWFTVEEYDEGFAFSQAAPGPIAPQLAMYLAFLRFGVVGSTLVVIAFLFTPFVLVICLSMVYLHYGGVGWVQSMLIGMAPAVVAIVVHATWQLGRGMIKSFRTLLVGLVAFALATVFHIELSYIIIGAGIAGILMVGRARFAAVSFLPLLLFRQSDQLIETPNLLTHLAWFFLKAGALTFGSGYVVVAFLQQGVVDAYQWLSMRQFLDGVAIGQITPGPVVITSAFVGYMVEGFPGAVVSIVSVILPIYIITIVGAPLMRKYRSNAYLQGFIAGANAAALGTIASVAVTMAFGAVMNASAAALALFSLILLFRWNTPSVLLLLVAGAVGLFAF